MSPVNKERKRSKNASGNPLVTIFVSHPDGQTKCETLPDSTSMLMLYCRLQTDFYLRKVKYKGETLARLLLLNTMSEDVIDSD